jgi:hypothetical protein
MFSENPGINRGDYRLAKIEHLINLVEQDDQGRCDEEQGSKKANPKTFVQETHLKLRLSR